MKVSIRNSLIQAIVVSVGVIGAPVYAHEAARSADALEITVLSTMLSDAIDDDAYSSFGEWGFSSLVEIGESKLLYDTGYHPDLVLRNSEKLGIELSDVEEVILSHAHIDHVGGLMTLRETLMAVNPAAMSVVHVAEGFFAVPEHPSRSDRDEIAAILEAYRATGGKVVVHQQSAELIPGVWLSGPVPRVHDETNWSESARILTAEGAVPDTILEDMSLIIETSKGLVVISGCGHAGIINIADQAISETGEERVVAAIGGFHLFEADDDTLQWTASQFRRIGLTYFIAAHCTGVEATFRLRQLAGLDRKNAVVGAVGQRYDRDGVYTGWIAQ